MFSKKTRHSKPKLSMVATPSPVVWTRSHNSQIQNALDHAPTLQNMVVWKIIVCKIVMRIFLVCIKVIVVAVLVCACRKSYPVIFIDDIMMPMTKMMHSNTHLPYIAPTTEIIQRPKPYTT